MTQGEVSASTEVYGIEEFISVRRVHPAIAASSRVRVSAEPQGVSTEWRVVFVRVEGHLLHLHTVAGGEYARRGTLNSLEQLWASYGLVRIHNSFLVFLTHVCELRHESNGPVAILGSGADAANLPISQRRFQEFKRLWEAHAKQ